MEADWWPTAGSLIAFMRYGDIGALELDQPDIREDDIDLAIGVESEEEWFELMQRFAAFWYETYPDQGTSNCFFKVGVTEEKALEAQLDSGVRRVPLLPLNT